MTPKSPRDEKGWRIPRVGTKSHKIYQLVKAGKTSAEIAKTLNTTINIVCVLIHKFKHPDYHNGHSHAEDKY